MRNTGMWMMLIWATGCALEQPVIEADSDSALVPLDGFVCEAERDGGPTDTEQTASCAAEDATAGDCVFDADPGYYNVRFAFEGEDVSVSVESRRFLVRDLDAASPFCFEFTVQVREPEGQPLEDVDPGVDGLNFVFSGDSLRLTDLTVTPAVDPRVLYLIGDSTVCDKEVALDGPPELGRTGWGQILPMYFRKGLVVANVADSGEKTATFRVGTGPLWPLVGDSMKAGDFVMIQLGHNEKQTPAAVYRADIIDMVEAISAKGAFPVLVTPMVRNNGVPLEEQHIYGDLNIRRELTEISQSMKVPLIDLMQMSAHWIDELGGRKAANKYFVEGDMTHADEAGAAVFAEMIEEGIRDEVPDLAMYLRYAE